MFKWSISWKRIPLDPLTNLILKKELLKNVTTWLHLDRNTRLCTFSSHKYIFIYQHCEQYSIMVCSVDSKSCVMKMYTISYFCRDVTTLLHFSAVLFSGSNSLMDLMVSFSMKYFIWTSSCFNLLAACLGVGRHDIGRLNTLDGRNGKVTSHEESF